jgi:2-amino-4-hydroxy-6-hydroxymethyldihydropteridine diphosphokinase
VDYQQTAGTVLDAECARAVVGLSFRAQSRNPVAPPLDLIAGCLDSARHDKKKMRTAVALGSNIGDRLKNLRAARKAIFDLPNVKTPILSSAVYETEPVGCEPGAGKFLNAVVEFEYDGDPARLLGQLIEIEEALGRKRDHPQNVSRIIDVDLLYCGEQRINDERLQLPHPRLHLREFVLRPLADIRPNLLLPGQKRAIRQLLAEVEQSGGGVSYADTW